MNKVYKKYTALTEFELNSFKYFIHEFKYYVIKSIIVTAPLKRTFGTILIYTSTSCLQKTFKFFYCLRSFLVRLRNWNENIMGMSYAEIFL